MSEELMALLGLISPRLILISLLLFFIGYTAAPFVYHRQVGFLLAWPMWVAKKLEQWQQKKSSSLATFIFILLFNTISLFLTLSSGLLPVLPVVLIVLTGLNIGVITFKSLGGEFYFVSLLNPVALLEIPVALVVFTMALQLNLQMTSQNFIPLQPGGFGQYSLIFTEVLVPVLTLAALIESFLIRMARKMEQEQDDED
jgi:hypothetical protein